VPSNPITSDFVDFETRLSEDFDASIEPYGDALPMGHTALSQSQQVALLDMMKAKPQVRQHFVAKYGENEVQRMERELTGTRVANGMPEAPEAPEAPVSRPEGSGAY
jgi:hypothetical protein